MIAMTVDDERAMLTALTRAVIASPDIEGVAEFTSCSEASEYAADHPLDIAFLDISMRGMGGLALAAGILERQPDCRIIFCTGYAQYAIDAFQLHVDGYLLKPITAEAVQREIDHIKGGRGREPLLSVKCFGNFEVLARGRLLPFRRSKSKELLAVLIDRNGAGLTGRQICAKMWPDGADDGRNANYLRQLFADLRSALEAVGAGEVLRQSGYTYAIDTARIDCDYYSYLRTGEPRFHGEYMSQYGWSEETCGLLWRK